MNSKILAILDLVSIIGAIVTSIAYIIFMAILVMGIEVKMHQDQLLLVSIVGAVSGLGITWMLKGQGVVWASKEPESIKVMQEYRRVNNKMSKNKKLHTIRFHLISSGIIDIFTKLLTVGASTYLAIMIFMEGNGDFSLIGLAIVNVLMFLSFGILALSKSYSYYINEHIPAIVEKTQRLLDASAVGSTKEIKDELEQAVQVRSEEVQIIT